jgi:hypothetical protein
MKLRPKTNRNQARGGSALPRDWVKSLPDRRKRRRADSARNGRPKKFGIVTGVNSRAVRGELDQRFGFAKTVSAYIREYQDQVGTDRSVAMDDICRSAGTAKAIRNLALFRLMRGGPYDSKDQARAAYENYRRADADLRDVLRTIGLERRERVVRSLSDVLAGKEHS